MKKVSIAVVLIAMIFILGNSNQISLGESTTKVGQNSTVEQMFTKSSSNQKDNSKGPEQVWMDKYFNIHF